MRRLSICLVALLAAVAVPAGASASPAHISASETHVGAFEEYFSPSSPQVRRGGTVVFDFDIAKETHTATDDSGLGLYNSGLVPPGGPSFTYTFVAAGVYPFVCTVHSGMQGRVHVPMRVAPGRGSKGTTFKVVWASVAASAGHAYDVQIRRPGQRWGSFQSLTAIASTSFTPHARGTFRFRARLHDTMADTTSDWSDPVYLDVV